MADHDACPCLWVLQLTRDSTLYACLLCFYRVSTVFTGLLYGAEGPIINPLGLALPDDQVVFVCAWGCAGAWMLRRVVGGGFGWWVVGGWW